ncbi:MAG TPA: peptidyl-prolyl cis-trans isomerase [Planctomycetota bacterium]|nr:peptidyl-prolyl cis-trans isomerase [Planctomycetota bacterium]
MTRKVLMLLAVVLVGVPSCALFRKERPPAEPVTFGPGQEARPRGTADVVAELDELGMARTRRPSPVRPTPPAVPTPAPAEEPRRPALERATYLPDPNVVGTVVAVVNGDIITKEDVLLEVRPELTRIDADPALTPVGREARRKELISTVLVLKVERLLALQQAKRVITLEEDKQIEADVDSIVKDTIRFVGTAAKLENELARKGQTIDRQKQAALDNRRIQALLAREVDAHVYVTPAEMQAYYEAHKTDYDVPGEVQVRQIFLDRKNYASAKEAADRGTELLKRIRGGEDFGKLAEEYSDGPYAKKGGLWDFVTQGSGGFRPEVEREAFRLPAKGVSGVITSEIGVHLIKVEDVRPARRAPFAEVQDEIAVRLRNGKRDELYRAFIKKLWDKSYVDIHWR